jgi:1-acyl-sn-glycerol-3-phosphate acyltransferase
MEITKPTTTSKLCIPPHRSPGCFYEGVRFAWRAVFACTMRVKRSGLNHLPPQGGVILAVCHVSHLDPIVVSALLPRQIGWVARIEFYASWIAGTFLHWGGAFPVDRYGAALPAVREGLRRLQRGEIVGIFPEGELMEGKASVLRGGGVKRGVCLLAARSGCPVLPVIVLGTDQLRKLGPWLPARRGRLWLRVGPVMFPEGDGSARQRRGALAARLEAEFVRLFAEARSEWELPDSIIP